MARLSEGAVLSAIQKAKGNVSYVARIFDVTRSAVWLYIQSRPTLTQALKDARESLVDTAESSLLDGVENGEGWAVMFTLKTQGKERGYVERQEITGKEGGPMVVVKLNGDASMGDL